MIKIGFCDDELSALNEFRVLIDQYREESIREMLNVTADTAFGEAPLFDGSYAMVFEMRDTNGNYALFVDALPFTF